MPLPHQLLERKIRSDFDKNIRGKFFRGLEFAEPEGDPGWFGPGSAVWHVHSHTPALIFGLQCAAFIERFDPSIFWMGSDHSRVVEHDDDGNPTGRLDLKGSGIRLAHSVAFFIGTAYGSTATAERVAETVRAMHHTIKGVRPDGLPYDADDPEWLRWNYATVVWGIATGHELYHPTPLRNIDRYYGEFVRVGHALGGTDLPSTKAETLDCLRSYLPRLALTHGAAMFTGPNLQNNPDVPQEAKFFDWAIRDSMPDWAAQMLGYQPPHPVERAARRAATWAALNGTHLAMDPLPEFQQACRRVADGTMVDHTEPSYVLGSDPIRSRETVEYMV
ncbi:oxygenase MpaB family protein [Mycolicibacterium aichiense]|uniref:oxygenase MpaB family protein n=1 Tax=Mycolicibacterium aichiense TaxID=1799 RepID=UPI003974E724